MTQEIVLARYKEDVSWADNLENVTIYNKGPKITSKHICHINNAILCDSCESLNPLDSKTCTQCLSPLFRTCGSCGSAVHAYFDNCPICGGKTGRNGLRGGPDRVGRPEDRNYPRRIIHSFLKFFRIKF